MPEIKKYTITLKYKGYPEFKIETKATSDEEAIQNAKHIILQNHLHLKDQEIVFQTITSSNAPY